VSQRAATAVLVMLTLTASLAPIRVGAQQTQTAELSRKAKSKVEPLYPPLARKMRLSGTVKIEVVVAPNGIVKDARVVGGHPVLANAALDAARKWRFEPSAVENTGVIEFKFEPQ
jgi:TonB family protein